MYFTASEQTPSLVSLGVLVSDERVESAGVLIVQLLPGASEAAIKSIENSAGMFMDISGTMKAYHLDGAVDQLLMHLQPRVLERREVRYACDCSRERVERALITLGAEELNDMLQTQHGAQVDCHFCNKRYRFSEDDLRALLAAATAKGDAADRG
jgi:molecular chaperone Hsp33